MIAVRRHTFLLLGVLVGVLAVDVAVHVDRGAEAEALPSLPAIDPASVTKIELSKGDDSTLLEHDDSGWRLAAPFEGVADPVLIDGLLAPLRDGVRMDVRVDAGDDEPYGLKNPDVVRVDVAGTSGPLAAFYVGFDAAGGSTFVRLADSDAIYRADIGGRHRFDRPPGEWRDHALLGIDPNEIREMIVERAGEPLRFVRSEEENPRWSMDGAEVDQPTVDGLALALARTRAKTLFGKEHPFADAQITVTIRLASGKELFLAFLREETGVAVRNPDRPGVIYATSTAIFDGLSAPFADFEDRTLFDLDPADIVHLSLVDAGLRTELARSEETWVVAEPRNLSIDPVDAEAAARALAHLRAEAITHEIAFSETARIELTTGDKTTYALELGGLVPGRPEGHEAITVRASTRPDVIAIVPAMEISRVRKAFSR